MRLNWVILNKRLASICADIASKIRSRSRPSPRDQFLFAFADKTSKTLNAIVLLHEKQLWEPAQVLIRVILETKITFDVLAHMLAENPDGTVQRLADAMMLEKIKQARESEYLGFNKKQRLVISARFDKLESKIKSFYSLDEFRKLKKHGFTGLSVYERAASSGNSKLYNTMYRNFSRNIHSTDYVEHIVAAYGIIDKKQRKQYMSSRNASAIFVAMAAAGGIAEKLNSIYRCGKEADLYRLAVERDGCGHGT